MGVKFKQATDSGGAATSFSDTFTRASLGNNYVCGWPQSALYSIAANQFAKASTGLSTQNTCFFLGAPGLIGLRSQYIQMQWIVAAAGCRSGPALFLAGQAVSGAGASEMQGYFFHAFPGTINLLGIKAGDPGYTLALALGAPAANDIFEMEAVIGTGSNRVRLWQNSTLLADVTDTDDNRPAIGGTPGFYGTDGGGVTTCTWDNLVLRPSR